MPAVCRSDGEPSDDETEEERKERTVPAPAVVPQSDRSRLVGAGNAVGIVVLRFGSVPSVRESSVGLRPLQRSAFDLKVGEAKCMPLQLGQ